MTKYNAEQYETNYPEGIEHHFWNSARNQIVLDALERAQRSGLWQGGTLLEVGCGTGVVVGFLRSRGLEGWGCDLGTPPQVGADAAPYLFLGQDFADLTGRFRAGVTCILLLDVLEHVEEPDAFLTRLKMAYPNAQCFLLTVPARQELWSNYDEFFGHRCRYHPRTLAADLERGGLAVVYMQYFFRMLYPVMYALGRLGIQREVATRAPTRPGLHRLIAWGCRQEARWLPHGLPGTSLLALARRR
jgi:2-polyprenyl-3-methyl-5-hydroxy-6-metoxy-1,4-benzoquinol methylase